MYCINTQSVFNKDPKNNSMINIISEDIQFNPSLKQFPNAKASVAVFGTQSSGKSTLMNYAFGCNFPVLNTKKGRQRCSRGVWYQNIKDLDLNIIDTEGFDSVQRNQQQRHIQKQLALFCLAIADIIIINIWMNEIGRYEGSQNHILKAIIKMTSKIAKPSMKTIIFAVKDCTQDADRQILKEYLIQSFDRLIQKDVNIQNKSKFDIQFLFLSHFIYAPEQYKQNAKKLLSLIKVRKSNLNMFSPQERANYLKSIWQKASSQKCIIDLKLQQQALRAYICNRVRKQIIQILNQELETISLLNHLKSYQRYIQKYSKFATKAFNQKKPLYLSKSSHQEQISLLQQEVFYVCSQHFQKIILPNQQNRIIENLIEKPLIKLYQSPKLQKGINQSKKQANSKYSSVIQGHKQSKVLSRTFSQRVSQACLKYQRQTSYMYNKFQNMLEASLNQQLDRQVQRLQFDPNRISSIIQRICKIFLYNEWEVNYEETWEKVSHRVLHTKLPHKIDQINDKLNFTIFDGPRNDQIIAQHKNLQKKVQTFCQKILTYLDQSANVVYIEDRLREKVHASLQKSLQNQAKRFHFSLLIVVIFMALLYGQFMLFITLFPLRKRQIANLGTLYIAVVISIIVWEVYKSQTKTKSQHN